MLICQHLQDYNNKQIMNENTLYTAGKTEDELNPEIDELEKEVCPKGEGGEVHVWGIGYYVPGIKRWICKLCGKSIRYYKKKMT